MLPAIRRFWSLKTEVEFNAAYDAVLREWPIPYEEIFIPTRFGDTHVIATGKPGAPPVMLLHPGGGNAMIWHRNVAGLSEHYRTYAVDIIGEMNRSISIRRITSELEFADWMTDVFEGLHVYKAHLIGNSNGGFFALVTALLVPDRVDKCVLISPAATFVPMWAWWWHLMIPAHMIAPVFQSKKMVARAYDWLRQDFPMDECYGRLHALSKVAGYPRYRPTCNSVAPRVFTDDELRKVRTPVLLLIGDHEVIYDPEKAMQRAKLLVHGLTTEIVPNANHMAQYTSPDAVNRLILAFLAR